MKNVTPNEWKKLINETDNKLIIDVRTPQEYQGGKQKEAINLDIFDSEKFISEIEKIDRQTPLFMYCRSGGRSGQACTIASSKGFKETYNLIGGMMEWDGEVI